MSSKLRIPLIVLLSLVLVGLIYEAIVLFHRKEILHEVTFSFESEELKNKTFEVNSEIPKADKVMVTIDNETYTGMIGYDDSLLDTSKIGEYIVRYYIDYDNHMYEETQTINIVDTTKPTITIEGKNVTLLVGEKYKESGFNVDDNYDRDLKDKVVIESNVDTSKAGTYKVTYKVSDSSGNEATAERTITVKKPYTVVATPPKETKVSTPKVVETSYSNTIKKNKFTNSSVTFEGYLKEPHESNVIKLEGTEFIEIPITINNNNYTVTINPENIPNGTYKMYINGERLLNKVGSQERLSRAKVGSKLVSFAYGSNDEVTIDITNHAYKYDIIINAGHGADDTGAVNEYAMEKDMNLTVSKYEKCRYEAHGLRVYMTRTGDYYGNNFGPSDLIRLHKVAYEMGYYGAVSKIVYSNHHNSIGNNYYSGYEILIPASLPASALASEIAIAKAWDGISKITDSHLRFYARDYDSEVKYSKLNGETYSFKDNYAVNRIPLATANVKSIIYEGCYMSNKEDFNWYWQDNNWYKMSEAKIAVYVKALGLSYNADNSSCL